MFIRFGRWIYLLRICFVLNFDFFIKKFFYLGSGLLYGIVFFFLWDDRFEVDGDKL